MAGTRGRPEEIVRKPRQVDVLQGQGMTISEAVRQIGVTMQTHSRWRKPRASPPLARGQWQARHEP